jgi:hypothetical protein
MIKSERIMSLGLVGLIGLTTPLAAQTIVDDDFDDEVVTGWMSQGNIRTYSAHKITETDSVLTSEVIPTQSDTNRGIVSTTAFDPSSLAGGFKMTFIVTSQGPPVPSANGYFIGIVSDNQSFFRELPNFGMVFFGLETRTRSMGGFSVIYGDRNGTAPADFIFDNSDAQGDLELASFQDGFTAVIEANAGGWNYSLTGLKTAAGVEMDFSGNGTWAEAGTDFATLFGGDDSWFVMASNQGPGAGAGTPTHSCQFDRITLQGGGGGDFRILTIAADPASADPSVTIRWSSSPGETYSVDYSEDLKSWSEIVDDVQPGGDTTDFTHHFLPNSPGLVNATKLFYRVRR